MISIRFRAGSQIRLAIVRKRADLLNNESPAPDGLSTATNTEVGVLPEEAGVFFVNTNNVLHDNSCAIVCYVRSGLRDVQIMHWHA